MIGPEELAVLVNTLAITIAKDKTIPELELLSSVFVQIADTLATISIQRANIEECLESKKRNNNIKK